MFLKTLIAYSLIGGLLSSSTPSVKTEVSSEKMDRPIAPFCFFIPPSGWEIADPKSLSSRVKMAFLRKIGSGFQPSMNLAIEETFVSLTEYLKAVKAIHEKDRNNRWRALGKVKTRAGLAQLTEIDSKTEFGPIRILQLIFLKDGYAYVITASALKEEFSQYYKEIQSAFRSLTLSTDLMGNIPQTDRRETLKAQQQELIQKAEKLLHNAIDSPLENPSFQKNYLIPFQQSVLGSYKDMGSFWQILVLKEVQEKLLNLQITANPPTQGTINE